VIGNVVVIRNAGAMIAGGTFDLARVLPAFYSIVPDSFDMVAVFGGSNLPAGLGAWAFSNLVRIRAQGLGRSPGRNHNGSLGIHTQRLLGIQVMNDLRSFGAAPTDPVPHFGDLDFTGVELLASEVMHSVGCWVNVDQVVAGADLAGRSGHWSYFLHGAASIMEGAEWRDNGDGTFTSLAVLDGFSELDEYLLGLRPAADVEPTFVIAAPDVPSFPRVGTVVRGTRIDVTIDDVITQNGPRVPDAAAAPHHFRLAFVLVVPGREGPLASDLAFLEQFRTDWEQFFASETEGLGTMDTSVPQVPATAAFESVLAGNAPLTVRFDDRSTGTVTGRRWTFEGGAPSSDAVSPERTFHRRGTFQVRLETEGMTGSSVHVRTVTVGGFRTVVRADFEGDDGGWTIESPNDATGGIWEWGVPEETVALQAVAQPGTDATPGGSSCWVTGASAGLTPADHDVDGGTTTLVTAPVDLSSAVDPLVSYARWYSDQLGSNSERDSLLVEATGDGVSWTVLETVRRSEGRWVRRQHRILDHLPLGATMRFRFRVSDLGPQSLVEAAVDDFEILDRAPGPPSPSGAATAPIRLRPTGRNPFRDRVTIECWAAGSAAAVTVAVFDLAGRRVRTLDNRLAGGAQQLVWDGRSDEGRAAAAGVYVIRAEVPGRSAATKVVLLR
jgi:PKD repeat protein